MKIPLKLKCRTYNSQVCSFQYYSSDYYLFHGLKLYVCLLYLHFFLLSVPIPTLLIFHFRSCMRGGLFMLLHAHLNAFLSSNNYLCVQLASIIGYLPKKDMTSRFLKIICLLIYTFTNMDVGHIFCIASLFHVVL